MASIHTNMVNQDTKADSPYETDIVFHVRCCPSLELSYSLPSIPSKTDVSIWSL